MIDHQDRVEDRGPPGMNLRVLQGHFKIEDGQLKFSSDKKKKNKNDDRIILYESSPSSSSMSESLSDAEEELHDDILEQGQEAHEKEGDYSAQISENIKIHNVSTWSMKPKTKVFLE